MFIGTVSIIQYSATVHLKPVNKLKKCQSLSVCILQPLINASQRSDFICTAFNVASFPVMIVLHEVNHSLDECIFLLWRDCS